jgi:hypothetical protein
LIFKFIARVFLGFLALSVLLGFYVSFFGLPRFAVRRIENRLLQERVRVRFERIRWDFFRGPVAENVSLYAWEDPRYPVFEADEVAAEFDLRRRASGEPVLRAARVYGGVFRVGVPGGFAAVTGPDVPHVVELGDIHGRVLLSRHAVEIEKATFEVMGIGFEAEGYIVRPEEPLDVSLYRAWVSLYRPSGAEGPPPEWLAPLTQQLKQIRYGRRPRGELEFRLHPVQRDLNEVTLALAGRRTHARGQTFDEWRIEAQLRGGNLFVPTVLVRQGDTELNMSGVLDFVEEELSARAFSTLAPDTWLSMIPNWCCDALRARGVEANGNMQVEMTVGPVDYRRPYAVTEGNITIDKTDLSGVWIENGSLDFNTRSNVLSVEEMEWVIGRDAMQGSASGDARLVLTNGQFQGRVEASFDPHAVVSLLSSNQARVVVMFAFEKEHPEFSGSFSGDLDDPTAFAVKGTGRGSNVVFRGGELSSFTGSLQYSNSTLRFQELNVKRPEGGLTGALAFDFSRSVATLDVVSSLYPPVIAQIIGPGVSQLVDRVQFNGPVHIAAKGSIDYRDRRQMDFQGLVNAERVGYQGIESERCSCKVYGRGTRIDVRNIDGVLADGSFHADAAVYPIGFQTNMRYEAVVIVTNADFSKLMASFVEGEDENPYEGMFDAGFMLIGFAGEGNGDTAKGEGYVRVHDGQLRRIPLFGGLTRYISKLFGNLGTISLTDFRADFDVVDRAVHTDEALLQGNIIRVTASGNYAFDRRLDFDATIQFLRESEITPLFDLITFPLKLFLDIHLGGHLDSPSWRPINLPKELYFKFD